MFDSALHSILTLLMILSTSASILLSPLQTQRVAAQTVINSAQADQQNQGLANGRRS